MSGEPFVVTLAGDLDMDNVAHLHAIAQDFQQSTATDARVLMTDVTFMDSAALSALLRLRSTAAERGGQVTLVGVPRIVRRVLEVTAMDTILVIERTDPDPPEHT